MVILFEDESLVRYYTPDPHTPAAHIVEAMAERIWKNKSNILRDRNLQIWFGRKATRNDGIRVGRVSFYKGSLEVFSPPQFCVHRHRALKSSNGCTFITIQREGFHPTNSISDRQSIVCWMGNSNSEKCWVKISVSRLSGCAADRKVNSLPGFAIYKLIMVQELHENDSTARYNIYEVRLQNLPDNVVLILSSWSSFHISTCIKKQTYVIGVIRNPRHLSTSISLR